MKTQFVPAIALSLLLLVTSACTITIIRKPSSSPTVTGNCPGCTPLYVMQMNACTASGGQVKTETKNMGTWQAIARWECICKKGVSYFGDHQLTCNQWSTPAP